MANAISYNDYTQLLGQGQDYVANKQASDPNWQAWNREAQLLGNMEGGAPASPNQDYWAEYRGGLTPQQQLGFTQNMADSKSWGDTVGKVLQYGIPLAVGGAAMFGGGGLGSLFGGAEAAGAGIGADAATSAAWGSGAGLGGDTLGAMGLSGAGQGSASLGSLFSNPAFVSLPEVSPGMFGGAFNNPAFTAIPGLEGGSIGAPAISGGGGVSNFIKNLTGAGAAGGTDISRTLSSLAGLYSSNKSNRNYSALANNMASMYKPGSSYEEQLRKELMRRDAAAGRRSQYGPRAVELQAKLAEMSSRNAPALAQIYGQEGAARNQMMKDLLSLGNYSGLIGGLGQLFGG
jgi:hypothetical protein